MCYTAYILVSTERMTNNGSAIATLVSGMRCFVYGALPNETVKITITEEYAKYCVGIVKEVVTPNPNRIEPIDKETYQATSPWQIMPINYEDDVKHQLIKESLKFGKVDFNTENTTFMSTVKNNLPEYYYRNKYIYYFTGDEYQFAAIDRGTHNRISGSSFSLPNQRINEVANEMLIALKKSQIFAANSLLSLLVRANRSGDHLMRLVVKIRGNNSKLPSNADLQDVFSAFNLEITDDENKCYYQSGSSELTDYLKISGEEIELNYGIDSFWQVNQNAFELALSKIAEDVIGCGEIDNLVDFYSGIGSIGLATYAFHKDIKTLKLVEIDANSIKYANLNADKIRKINKTANIKVIKSDARHALDHITSNSIVIVDPPRAGLNKTITKRMNDTLPQKIIYLSCDTATFARDLFRLQDNYKIKSITGYNFFPKTPHIEVLGILQKR